MSRPKPTPEQLRTRLSSLQYHVTQEKGTERAFTGKYFDHKATGTYVCVCCSTELFRSVFFTTPEVSGSDTLQPVHIRLEERKYLSLAATATVNKTEAETQPRISGTVQHNTAAPPSHRARLVVDLRTLDTGIGLRTEHMQANYLEVDRAAGYDQAVLSDIDVAGLKPDAPEGKARFSASLALHGVTRSVSGQAEVRRDGAGLKVKASFPVQLSNHMIPEPRYLGVGVKDQVTVEVTFTATPEAATNATR